MYIMKLELVFTGHETPYSIWEIILFCFITFQVVMPLLGHAFYHVLCIFGSVFSVDIAVMFFKKLTFKPIIFCIITVGLENNVYSLVG